MTQKDHLSVTVYRVNESMHQSPTETFEAFAVAVDADGTLSIKSACDKGASFATATWGEFQVTRLPSVRVAAGFGGFVGNG